MITTEISSQSGQQTVIAGVGRYFYGKYATASGVWGMITATWNHLWFVAYLFIHTLLIIGVGPLLKRLPARFVAPLASGLPVVILPFAFLLVTRLTLEPMFGETHALFDDWYAHALYFPAFLFGFAIAKHEAFFESCERMRWPLLAIALASWATLQIGRASLGSFAASDEQIIALIGTSLRELQAWTMIIALIGFARKHLRHDNAARRYLTLERVKANPGSTGLLCVTELAAAYEGSERETAVAAGLDTLRAFRAREVLLGTRND